MSKPVGWRGESLRHAEAARGRKTERKIHVKRPKYANAPAGENLSNEGWWKFKAWKQDENGKDIKLSEIDLEHISSLIKEGYTGGEVTGDGGNGWWDLKSWKQDDGGKDLELNDADLEHISEGVEEGYIEGEVR
jgi:hypothetical protein